uniref:Major facilitator superfamily (MFS) profile domain-containing protein n=1 Tax=Clastoptera arizonana TaxID=38151 RepID=A0A1B6CWD1_9HEMI
MDTTAEITFVFPNTSNASVKGNEEVVDCEKTTSGRTNKMLHRILPSSPYNLGIFRQYIASLAVAFSQLMIGMGTAWPSPVLPNIREHSIPLHMDNIQISWMVSLLFLGNTISPIPSGYLMDIFGRKKTLLYLNLLPLLSWIFIWYATYPGVLYFARFLNGLWSGTVYTIVAVYIGEIAQPDIRGSLSNFNNLLKSTGSLFVFVTGPYISYSMLAIICGIVPVIFFLVFSYMPESPYYLLMAKNKTEARKSLKWLRGDKVEIELESELNQIERAVELQTRSKATVVDLVTDPVNLRASLLCNMLAVNKLLSGFDVMVAYTSTTLPKHAFKSFGPNECVIVLGVIAVLACILSGFILDRFNRKSLLVVSSMGCGITTLIAGIWFFFDEKTDIDVQFFSPLPFYCFSVHSIVYSIGLGPIVANVKGEFFFSEC